jgi:ATP-dependent helicase/nuclease subunit A
MVESVHAACREFCKPIPEARRELLRSVTEMHAGREPETFDDLLSIVDALADYDPEFVRSTVDDPGPWVDHARETYRATRRLAGDFGRALAAFDERYDRLTRERGPLTHTDITYLLREFLEGDPPGDGAARRDRFAESLADRFRYVVVDEFQDTNYAQCRVLAHLIDGANVLLIGDLKQSIYEWRSAEPRLFAEVVAYAEGRAESNVLDAEEVETARLAENFRSHPHLVAVANHVFPRVFGDPGRGGIGTFDVEYDPLSARRVETEPDRAHVHALELEAPEPDGDRTRREAAVEAEAERVAGTLRRVLDEGTLRVDRDRRTVVDPPGEGADADGAGGLSPVRPGDVAILFRTRRYVRTYSRVLDRYGVDNAVIGRDSLFREPEVGALVDALAWLGRPDDRGRVRRIAESPLVGLSEDGVRRLAAHRHDLDRALAEWDGDERDRRELAALARLREDLRYVRDGSKARLVSELLVHSAFDVAALAAGDGLQRYANLRRFVDVVDGWEDGDRLSYGEFVRRLERLRDGRIDDDTGPADVADADSPETVKLLTAHTAKGQEFPVVVLADTTHDEANLKACDRPFVADRRHGLALRPSTGGSEQPPGAADAFPNFEGGWFHDDDSGFDRDRGLLWLSERRGTDGRIRHDHPFSPAVRDRRAEFWRLLYVAVTRAGDHLVIPFPEPTTRGEWTTWAAALGEYLDPVDGVLDTDDGPVPVGVDGIDPADPPEVDPVDVEALLTGGRPPERPDPPDDPDRRFRPASLSATDLPALAGDPPRVQRAVLRGAGAADPVPREDVGAPTAGDPAAGAPDGVAPDDWGTAVHAALAAVHGDPDPGPGAVDRAVADALGDHPRLAPVRERIRGTVLPAYRGTPAWATVDGADRALPEFPVVADLPGDGTGVLRGRVDLLYRAGGWRVREFKTGAPASADSDRGRAHRGQVDAYAWLLREAYGVDVGGELLYLPAGEHRDVDPDPEGFAARLSAAGDLYVDREGVLRRRP